MKRLILSIVMAIMLVLEVQAKESHAVSTISQEAMQGSVIENSLFTPDFAFPADVKATAQAFLKSKGTTGSDRVMAVEELAMADLQIDRKSFPSVLATLLKFADDEKDAATRAMFLAYAGVLCRTHGYAVNGNANVVSPDPKMIEQWSYRAYSQASDSLTALALETAPKDIHLGLFSSALSRYVGDLAPMLRDFIVLVWTNGFGRIDDENRKAMDYVREGSSLWYYYKGKTLKDSELSEFGLKHLDNPNVAYFVALYLSRMAGTSRPTPKPYSGEDRSKISLQQEQYNFLTEVEKANIPDWLRPYVQDKLTCLKKESWSLDIPNEVAAGNKVMMVLNSVNTDSLTLNLYRFDKGDDVNLEREKLRKLPISRTVVMRPHSGLSPQSDTLQIELPVGHYVVDAVNDGMKYLGNFNPTLVVTPWIIVGLNTHPKVHQVQILDAVTGKGVPGLKIKAEYYDQKTKYIDSKTDAKGLATFKVSLTGELSVTDPRTGFNYKSRQLGNFFTSADYLWMYNYIYNKADDTDRILLTLTTDRRNYRPGDTVKWIGVFQNKEKTVAGRKENLVFSYSSGENHQELKLDMPESDVYGRVSGQFDIPKDADPGNVYLKAESATLSLEVSDFKLAEMRFHNVKYTLEGDSVCLTGEVINRVDAPYVGVEVALRIDLDSDSTFVQRTLTDTRGQYRFVVKKNLNHDKDIKIYDNRYYTLEAVSPDGYNATWSASYPIVKTVQVVLNRDKEYDQTSYDVTRGFAFQIKTERLGSNKPDEPIECQWLLVPKKADTDDYVRNLVFADDDENIDETKAVLRGKAMSGVVNLTPAMTDTLSAGVYFLYARTLDGVGNIPCEKLYLYNPQKTALPEDILLWTPASTFDAPEGTSIKATVGAKRDMVAWLMTCPEDQAYALKTIKLKKGYNFLDIVARGNENVYIWAANEGETATLRFGISEVKKKDRFTVSIESMRQRSECGTEEHWNIVTRYNDSPVEAAVVLNVYDVRLNNLARPVPLRIYTPVVFNPVSFTASSKLAAIRSGKFNISRIATGQLRINDLTTAIYPTWRYSSSILFSDSRNQSVSAVMDNVIALRGVGSLTGTVSGLAVTTTTPDMAQISGIVRDDTGEPICGAFVSVQGGTRSVTTDLDGRFSLNVTKGVKLNIAYIGCESYSFTASQSCNVDVTLSSSNELLETVVNGYGTKQKSRKMTAGVMDQTNSVMVVEEAPAAPASSLNRVEVRQGLILNALWRPTLTTDAKTGCVNVDWLLPNQASTWAVSADAWTKDLKSASTYRQFVAIKPLYVTPNLPRFVRVGDRVNIVTSVTNDTDTIQNVVYDVIVGETVTNGSIQIPGRSMRYVTTPINVDGMMALNDSLSLTFRVSNGAYGDGELVKIPILPSTALLTESDPFYLAPSQTSYTIDVNPGNAALDKTELHFTVNPLWTVVESLASVLDSYNETESTATQYAQYWYAAHTARAIGEKHEAVQGVIDMKKAKAIESSMYKKLKKLQDSYGGFRWGSWAKTPSVYVTLGILSWFDQDVTEGNVKFMLEMALRYVDFNIVPKNRQPESNLLYTSIRLAYGEPDVDKAKQVVSKTIAHVKKNWKSMSLNDKCLAANVMYRTGNTELAKEILRSVSQFGVVKDNRGLVFPNMPGIVGYANMLEAFYLINPKDTIVDAVRQGLINLRRGANWGSDGHTVYAVRAMLSGGSDWITPAEKVYVSVNGVKVELPEFSGARGAFNIDIPAGIVEICRTSKVPAYGSVVTRRVTALTNVTPATTKEVSITKAIYAENDKGERVPIEQTSLYPGRKVIVSITVKADQEMTNVVVDDARSATLEPIRQTGQYKRAQSGTSYYAVSGNLKTTFYIDRLVRGYSTLEYEAIINNSGIFTTGVATVTSGEDPDLTAHSGSTILKVLSTDK